MLRGAELRANNLAVHFPLCSDATSNDIWEVTSHIDNTVGRALAGFGSQALLIGYAYLPVDGQTIVSFAFRIYAWNC